MAFLDFFWKKAKNLADASAQSIINSVSGRFTEMALRFTEINDRLQKLETKQKETSLQLEEIDEFLQSNGSETELVDALVELADTIGDFYLFSAADKYSSLFEQAQMMWNTTINAAEAAGLGIIQAENEPFDIRLHSAENTEQDNSLPNGYIIKTLKCGYIYKDEVMRRAMVVVNKIDTLSNQYSDEENFNESRD